MDIRSIGDAPKLSPQERVFRQQVRMTLEELVEQMGGHTTGVYTYTDLVAEAHSLLSDERRRLHDMRTAADSEGEGDE